MLAVIQGRTFCFLVCCQTNVKIRIYGTVILHVVLYVCESWSLTIREEHILREFENRVLRRMFEPKRDKVRVKKTA
jgi:hypothetical protein